MSHFKPAFAYTRPKTSVLIKAGTSPSVKHDVVGTIIPGNEVPALTRSYAEKTSGQPISFEQRIVYVSFQDTLLCFPEREFNRHLEAGRIKVYG